MQFGILWSDCRQQKGPSFLANAVMVVGPVCGCGLQTEYQYSSFYQTDVVLSAAQHSRQLSFTSTMPQLLDVDRDTCTLET